MLMLAAALTCLMVAVMITDLTRYIIPNWLVFLLLALYPVMMMMTPARPDWKIALIVFAATFALGFVIFLFKIMGGGDVKLLAVAGLWTGAKAFAPFIMGVAIIGGGIGLFLLLSRPLFTYFLLKFGCKADRIPRVLTVGQPLPYGLAICAAFLIVLWTGQMPGIVV